MIDFDNKIDKRDFKKIGIICQNEEFLSVFVNSLKNKNIVVVTNTLFEANNVFESLTNYNKETLFFPTDDFFFEDAFAASPELEITRIETLNKIVKSKNNVVVTNLMGLIRFLPTKDNWNKSEISLNVGDSINKKDLISKLISNGYNYETLVKKTGDLADRGLIIDIFPCLSDNPIRIELWDDIIDSIRTFDVDSQRSYENLDKVTILPISEFISDTKEVERKQKNLIMYEKVSSLIDYMDDCLLIFKDKNQLISSYSHLLENLDTYKKDVNDLSKGKYFHSFDDIKGSKEINYMTIDNISEEKYDFLINYDVKDVTNYKSNFELLNADIKAYLKQNKTIILCVNSKKQVENLSKYINHSVVITNENKIVQGSVNVIEKKINKGFLYENYFVLSEQDLFGQKGNLSTYKSKFKYGTKILDYSKLEIGDYIVHEAHGIGIYRGIVAIESSGIKKDYIHIEYKNNENLYIPVEKIDLISKYSQNEGETPKINSLNGVEWQRTKQKVRNRIKDIAEQLIKTSAERALKEGFSFSKDDQEQFDFEKEFIYEETKDQLIATKEIKKDMESKVPMDRVLCGDVGYGKTEVAFRAIFKAVNSGKQVAYLCPTTLLSNQQYKNAINRFKSFAMNIELLNRFTSKKDVSRIINGLKNGTIDIVFGTHRLLSNDVGFKNLGLLIIDEEQRFGVIHKEKIKEYKLNVDILTLSATPIPRTLQMAMVGLKGLSLIETPPLNRYPVQTYVLEESDHIFKEAIYKELSRKGQIYILYNNVRDIEEKANEISKMVKEAKVVFAHGQMNKDKIENIMIDFINKESDILVCTTIIETGIDIPNVNTLIVLDANRFGLSQLYQIRGRVGRTNKIAYAYLMYNKNKIIGELAKKRLKTIKEFTELGSGLSIALRDLSIRGSGDILGSEQSGFIDSVGIELYTKIINEEVEKLNGNFVEKEEKNEDIPLISVDTHIDDSYQIDETIKIEIHKKINEIDSYEKLVEIKQEIEDRFGKVTDKMLIYMYQEWFEKLARDKGIELVNQNRNSIDLLFHKDKTELLDIKDLYYRTLDISKNFNFSYEYKRLKVSLNTFKLEKHWLYYALEFLIIVDK